MASRQARTAGRLLTLAMLASGAGLFVSAQSPQQVGTWAPAGAIGDGRTGAASAVMRDGTTIIAGGVADETLTNSVLRYDPETRTTVAAGELLAGRAGHTATALRHGYVLVIGGRAGNAPSGDVELLDTSSGSSTLLAQLSQPRSGHAAAEISDGIVLVFGGVNADGVVLDSVERVNVATGVVSVESHRMLQPRSNASATTLIDGRVLVAGGSAGGGDLRSAELYIPWSGSFEPVSTQLSVARSGHTATLLPHNGGVLIAGGVSNGAVQSSADLFVPAASPDPFSYGPNAFAATASMAVARAGGAAGAGREGFAWVEGGGAAGAESYRFATIKTDKDDYAPGETAVITGTGWVPGEAVHLLFQEYPSVHPDYELTLTADEAGNIFYDEWAPEAHDVGVRFYLLASDSRSRALTTFTDANLFSTIALTVTPNSLVLPGATLTWGVDADCVDNGGNRCSDGAFTAGGPVASGYSLTIKRATNSSISQNVVEFTVTLNATGVASGTVTAPTTAGTYFYRADHDVQTIGANSWRAENSNVVSVTVVNDTTAPTTTLTVGTPKFGTNDRFVTGASTFTLACADNAGGTGCAATFYQIVGAAATCPVNTNEALWTAYSTPFTLPAPDGEVRVCYFSKDTAGNREAPKNRNHVRDTTAPVTTATATSNASSYASGTWTRNNVSVSLNATDGTDTSGVKEITYAATGATTIPSATVAGSSVTTLLFSTEGTTTLTFFAKDNLNNTETTKTFTIRIDKTAPTITNLGPTTSANGAGWYNADVVNRFRANDTGSGLDAACLAAFPDVAGERIQSKTTSGEGQTITVTSDSCADEAGNTATAVTSAEFKIDKTAPLIEQIGFSPAANAAGWHNSDVTVRFRVTESLSGLDTACATAFPVDSGARVQSRVLSTEGNPVTIASDGCTDAAGNAALAVTSTPFKIDKTKPTIVQLDFSPAANAAGWNNTNVTVRFKATDALSGLVGTCAAFLDVSGERIQSKTIEAEGIGLTTTSDSCTDVAGNTAAAITSTEFKIDKVKPVIEQVGFSPAANAAGWHNTDVTVRFKVTDALSGIDTACETAFPVDGTDRVQSKTASSEGAAVTVASDSCTDVAGNLASPIDSTAFKIDKTKPTIVQHDVSPAPNAAGWNNTNITVRFKATDALSGLLGTCAAFLDVSGERIETKTIEGEGTGLTTMSSDCTDVAGNTAAAITSATFKIDKTKPVISNIGPTTSPNTSGWYKTAVVNQFAATDNLSGLDAACLALYVADGANRVQSKTTTGEGNAVTVTSSSCSDEAGNTADGLTSVAFQIDLTAPVILNLGPTTTPNAAGWYNTDVTNQFKVVETLSGPDTACAAAFPLVGSEHVQAKTTSIEGNAVTVSSDPCADRAGNVAMFVSSATFKIDKTAPLVAIVSPVSGNTILLSVAVNGTASDNLSGVKSVSLNGVAALYNPVAGTWAMSSNVVLACGPNTLTALATDYADLTRTATVTLTRLCFTFEYLKPLEQSYAGGLTIVNDGKYGRVIPVKGIVRRSSGVQTEADLAALGLTLRIGVNSVACSGGAATDAVEEYADAGTSNGGTNMFRWTLDGFFIYNLDTKTPPGVPMFINNCYRLDAYVQDAALNKVKISESPYAIFKPVK